jgi:hypothetical protein
VFASASSLPLADQLLLHTWLDCSLHELIASIIAAQQQQHSPLSLPQLFQSSFSFALVYPDRTGKHVMRTVGIVKGDGGVSSAESDSAGGGGGAAELSEDDAGLRTLEELKLEPGDYMDVAILPPPSPQQHGSGRPEAAMS